MSKKIHPDLPVRKNACYEAEIVGMTQEGNGVAKISNFPVFVPLTCVGDRIRVRVVKVLSSYAFGRLEQVQAPSADRIQIDCPVFRQCGGCSYRHLTYEAELRIKEQQVKDAFQRIGKIKMDPLPIQGDALPMRYRNKAQFPFGIDDQGNPVLGFFAPRSHRIIACEDCLLQPELFSEISLQILKWAEEYQISVYREENGSGILRHLYLRTAKATGEVMLCLVGASKKCPQKEALIRLLQEHFPQIVSVYYNYNSRRDNVILGTDCTLLSGKAEIEDILCGVRVKISPLSFYQVNHDQAEALYRKAMEFADLSEEDVLMDLYCGIGTIGLTAASRVKQLIGVEVIPEAIEDAKINAAFNHFQNTRFLCGDCKEAVAALETENLHPNVIIVDPPRKGCDREVLESIVRFAPERLVMVSCNPSTAARDCAILEKMGYQVERYQPFDLFPRTCHVETVISLKPV